MPNETDLAAIARAREAFEKAQGGFSLQIRLLNAMPALLRSHDECVRLRELLKDCLSYVEESWLKERIRAVLTEKDDP